MMAVVVLQSVEGIMKASKEDLVLCPGLGPQKVSKSERCEFTTEEAGGSFPGRLC